MGVAGVGGGDREAWSPLTLEDRNRERWTPRWLGWVYYWGTSMTIPHLLDGAPSPQTVDAMSGTKAGQLVPAYTPCKKIKKPNILEYSYWDFFFKA
jgi:hypothetical protein